jgi:hypothetical protein
MDADRADKLKSKHWIPLKRKNSTYFRETSRKRFISVRVNFDMKKKHDLTVPLQEWHQQYMNVRAKRCGKTERTHLENGYSTLEYTFPFLWVDERTTGKFGI